MAARFGRLGAGAWSVLRVLGHSLTRIPRYVKHPSTLWRDLRDSPIRRRLDPRIAVWERQINEAFAAQSWAKVLELMRTVMRISGAIDTPANRLKLIHSHVHLRQLGEGLDQQFVAALKRHPDDEALWAARAERALAAGDFASALSSFEKATAVALSNAPKQPIKPLPVRGTIFDWYEAAWVQCVDRWDELWTSMGARPSSLLYQRLIPTLVASGEFGRAMDLGLRAVRAYPQDTVLAWVLADCLVRGHSGLGAHELLQALRTHGGRAAASLADQAEQALVVLNDIQGLAPTKSDELRILTVHHQTGTELMVRAGNFWDEKRIHEESLRLAKRDGWPEQTSDQDLLSVRSWEEAQKFAASRAKQVGVSAPALARAVFHYFKQELTQKIPVDRIADEIARTNPEQPVFIDLGPLKVPYMVSHPTSRMQTLYFYDALRKRGCNVSLVRFPRPQEPKRNRWGRPIPSATAMPTLMLVPQPAQLKPPSRPLKPARGNPSDIVVPSGIRSVKRLLDRLDSALVVNSGSAVKGFAYDRSIQQSWDYGVNITLHGDEKNLLPTFRIKTTPTRAWRRGPRGVTGSAAAPSTTEAIEAFVSTGVWAVTDWHSWLERAIVPYFRDFVRRIRTALQEHAIMDAHIGDYLYAESVLVAAKVKDRGGRVHLWPHSTNPVHVDFQDPGHISTVHAVTKSGAAMWEAALPRSDVRHDAGLMLDPPKGKVKFVEGEPLSIVVIGGRPVMRNLPILDIAPHENLYRRFFSALEPLVQQGRVKVYFKPRGMTGEHELWLERLVGRSANWSRVLEHPLRMNLTNPLFVSLSVGSSALLEGGTRGIPGMIVREGFARDYLATEDGMFEAFDVAGAVDHVAKLTAGYAWNRDRDRLINSLVRELTPRPVR